MSQFRLALSITCAALLPAAFSHAAVAVYTENFDSYTSTTDLPTGFTEGGTSGTTTSGNNTSSSIVGTSNKGYQMVITTNQTTYGSVAITNLATDPFSVSVQFTLDVVAHGGSNTTALTTNIVAFASGTDLSTGTNYRLGYNSGLGLNSAGRLTLTDLNGTGLTVNAGLGGGTQTGGVNTPIDSSGVITPPNVGNTTTIYTLTLSGYQLSGTVYLTGTLFDGSNTITVGATDASPLSGTNFGMRIASNNSANYETVTFDNFQVVPEPSKSLLMFGSLGLLVLRRRR